jgi:protein-S-isoprenylcysteine O-methyltransferase Ste14
VKIRVAATLICACWWIAEYIRSSIRDKTPTENQDRGSSSLWDFAHLVCVVGVITGFTHIGRFHDRGQLIAVCGIALMLVGISARWIAVHTLGMYFSGKVSVLEGQHIVKTGFYEHVRHPAYSGSLLAYLGMGLVFTNSISFALIFFPVLLAALYRIRVEERILKEAFGDEYNDYSRSTKRLVPGVY